MYRHLVMIELQKELKTIVKETDLPQYLKVIAVVPWEIEQYEFWKSLKSQNNHLPTKISKEDAVKMAGLHEVFQGVKTCTLLATAAPSQNKEMFMCSFDFDSQLDIENMEEMVKRLSLKRIMEAAIKQ